MKPITHINPTTWRIAAFTAVIILFAAACSFTSTATPTPTPEIPPVTPTEGALEPTPTEPPPSSTDLPAALYLLSKDAGDLFQVWRISQDRSTTTQMTSEPENVDEFAVNPITGQIAYLTNDQVFIINADTTGRTLLIDGSTADQTSDEYFFREKIAGLSWNNEGTQLAYGQNGLNLYTLASSTSEKIIENELEEQDSGFIFPRAIYSPLNWSPDGSLMLVDVGFYEGGTINIFSPASGEVTQLGEGIVCCHPTWSPDSGSIVVASPFIGMISSGLWRYDVNTGAQTELIPTTSENNILNFAGWPVVLPDGQLQFFYGITGDFPGGDVPLQMVRTAPDGQSNLTVVRNEDWLNYEVLWSPDGRLAVTVQPIPGVEAGWPRIGPVVLLPASEDGVDPLGINGYQLQWGP